MLGLALHPINPSESGAQVVNPKFAVPFTPPLTYNFLNNVRRCWVSLLVVAMRAQP